MSPQEFDRHETAEGELWLSAGFERAAADLGLSERGHWERYVASGAVAGRGRVAFVETGNRRIAIKKLHRGGRYGGFWRDRFHSRSRLLANLKLPLAARARGIRTPAPLALLLVPGPVPFWRGWFALEAVPGSIDLIRRTRDGSPSGEEWREALGLVRRLHEAGIEHPDLNLGNLLLDDDRRAWVIDLDRCRIHAGPLGVDVRIDAIRRIERSYLKICSFAGIRPDPGIDWLELYAPGEPSLAARWNRRRERDRAILQIHRWTWQRPPTL